MASNDTEKELDPALAHTMAGSDLVTSKASPGSIPRTHAPGTDVRSADPALAATMTPEVATSRGRATTSLTTEHPGRYIRDAEIGRGGMGRVLVVKDTHLGRDVAMKELLDQTVPNADAMSIGSAARFLREARITGQLEHPGIVPVHELGQRADGTIYYTMKRIRGRSLASVLKEKTSLKERLTLLVVFRHVCEAVAYAHSKGVVHRDLKPDNVMVGEFGDTLVVDWGLAKVRGEAEITADSISGQSGRHSSADDLARTMDGHAIGTPAYMSPEQARGELGSIDERADVWGLGTILFEILAGRAPYVGTSAFDVLAKVLDTPPPRVLQAAPEAPVELAAIVDRALMRDASSRYPNAGEVAKEIGAYLDGRTVGAYEYSSYELFLRFVRRHRAASFAVVSVVLSIVVASIAIYDSFLGEQRARASAEAARDEAMDQRTSAEDSMHAAEGAVADALLERAERALASGDCSGAAVFAAGVLVRDSGAVMHAPPARRVRALSLYIEAEARRRYVFERLVPGAHLRSGLSSDGRLIAIPTESAIRVVDLEEDTEQRIELRARRVRALGANGLAVIAGEAPGVYDLSDGHRVVETPDPMSAQITPTGILVTAADGTILLLAPDGTSELGRWTSTYRGQVRAALSPTGERIAVISTDVPELEVWAWPLTGDAQRIHLRALPSSVAFAPDGGRLGVLASDFVATVGFRDATPADSPEPDAGHGPLRPRELSTGTWPTALAWDDSGALALYENGDHLSLRDPVDAHTLDVVHFPAADGGRIEIGGERLVFFPSTARASLGDATVLHDAGAMGRDAVALGAGVRDVQLDVARHRVIATSLSAIWTIPMTANGHFGTPTELATVPSGVGIVEHVRITDDGTIVLLTLRGGLVIAEAPDYTPVTVRPCVQDYSVSIGLRGLVVSPDGDTIYVGSPADSSVLRWSRRQHGDLTAIDIPTTVAQSLAVSADGAHLAIGGRDGSIRIVRLSDTSIERTIVGDDESVSALAYSPRGDRLAIGDQTGRVRVVDPADGRVIATAPAHQRYVNGITWSTDGRWIVTASDDPSVHVLSPIDLEPARIVRPSTAPFSAQLAADGSHLLYHDGRSILQLDLRMAMTDVEPVTLLEQAEQRSGVRLDGLMLAARTE